jgi:hypothetical protein
MRYLGLLLVALLGLAAAGSTGTHADSASTCPPDSRRFDYSGLVLCWPNKDETVDISLYESLGLAISEIWIGNSPASDEAFNVASQRNKVWPSGGTQISIDFVPFGHWKASLGGSSQLEEILVHILLQQTDFETVDGFTVRTEDEGTLAFTRIGDDVFAASRETSLFATPKGRFEYRARFSGGVVDYVMRCLVEQEPGWWPLACRAIWLTDRYAMVGTVGSNNVDAAMMVYEKMREKILSHLIRPKLTLH